MTRTGPLLQPARSAWMPGRRWRMPHSRLLGQLDLGDQAARRRLPPGELDAGRLADQAAPAVAPDEILAHAATARRRARRRRRHRPARTPSRRARDGSAPPSSPTHSARIRSMWFCHSPSPYGWRVGKSLMSSGIRRSPRPAPPFPPTGTGRRCHADRGPRWCGRAGRPRACPRAPGSARRSTMATSTPASASSPASISPVGPLRRSPPRALSCRTSTSAGPAERAVIMPRDARPHEGAVSAVKCLWRRERVAPRARRGSPPGAGPSAAATACAPPATR